MAGLIIGLLIVPVVGFLYFQFGFAPVATASTPMPLEKFLASSALHAAIGRSAPKESPIQPSVSVFMAGAHEYRQYCAVCHGLPGQPQTAIGKGEYPKPPLLLKGKGVTDDPPGETFWKVKNGIRLTGMPAFDGALSDQEIWWVSLMLANADKLPDLVLSELRQPEPTVEREQPEHPSSGEQPAEPGRQQ